MPASAWSDPDGPPKLLTAHLEAYLGAWPPSKPVEVVASSARLEAAWDGASVPAVAVASRDGAVVSVPPEAVEGVERVARSRDITHDAFRHDLAESVGWPGRVSPWAVLRWTATPAPLPDAGEWVDAGHPALPDWLHAFSGPVLAAFDDGGRYLAGVGMKHHTDWGRELAVGTAEAARGRGLARRLVAQAARAVLDAGAIPLYVHDPANVPSARVADAAGFPDRDWRLLAVWGR